MPKPPKRVGFLMRCRWWVAVLLPLAAFAAVQPYVDAALNQNDKQSAFTLLGAALLLFVLAEALLFRLVLLPRMGQAVGEKLYGGSYIPEEDRLVQAVEEVRRSKDREKLGAVRTLVQADRRRLRGWQELARLYQEEFGDMQAAAEVLTEGAAAVGDKEDRALLLYRAARLYEQMNRPERRLELLREAADRYGETVYGKKAAALL